MEVGPAVDGLTPENPRTARGDEAQCPSSHFATRACSHSFYKHGQFVIVNGAISLDFRSTS